MSRDVFSKNKEKRPRTSSEESNNSFVKNVTSRVSGYLPATITKWFSSPRATANGSAPAADATDSSTEDEAPESPAAAQPPAKRMRYNTTVTETNCVTSNIETIDISPSYSISSPPGRSTFRRDTDFASTPIRSPEESAIERADKATMFPHTVSGAGPSLPKKRKSLFGNQSQEISEVSKKACVKTANSVVRDPRQPCFKPTLLGSPFYAGRTTYGGAASSYINQPNITQRQTATVREAASNTDNTISHSARRVLELLESYSSPLAEAKRIPQYNRPTKQEIAKRMSDSLLAAPYSKTTSYKTQELHVPRIASILRLKQRSRLNDTTNAARQLIASHSSSSPDYLTHPYGTRSDQTQTETSNKLTTKVKSRLTRPARGESNALDTETVTPPDLPKAVLQIDPNNLPNFSTPLPPKTTSTDKLIAKKAEPKTKPVETISKPATSNSNSVYNFSNPVRITSESPKTTSTPPKFTFGSPERSIETLPAPKQPEPAKPLIVTKEVEKKTTESKPWQCPDCWVSNKADVDKCVCCGYNNTPKPAKKSKCTLCKLADSEDNSERCVNCNKVQVNNIAKPLKAADTSKWQCKDCWVDNKDTADKCVCCGAKNPKATQSAPAKKPDAGAMCSKCFAAMTLGKCTKCESSTKPTNSLEAVIKSQAEKWECEHCLVRNETTKSKCVCCGADRSGHVEKEPEVTKFNFGTGISNFKFGIDLKVQQASLAKATEAPAEKKDKVEESETNNNVLAKAPTFSFGMPAKKPEDETDSVKEKKEEAPKPTFSFGIPKQNSIAPSTPAPLFSFTSKVADAPKTDAEVKEKPQEEKKPEEAPKPIIFGATPAPTSTTTASQPTVPAFTLDNKIAASNSLNLPATSAEAAPALSLSASKPGMGLFTPPSSITFNATPTPASGGLFQKTDDTSKPLSIFQKSESPASVPTPATSLFQKPEASAPSSAPSPSPAPAPGPVPAPASASMFSFGSAAAAPPADKPKFNFTFGATKTDNVFKPPTFGAPADNAPKFTLGSAAPENPLAVNPLSSGTSLTGNSLSSTNSLPVNSLGVTNALPTNNLQATPSIFGSPAQKPEPVQNPMWSAPAPSAPNPFNATNNVAKPFSFGSSTPFSSAPPAFGAATTQAPATPAFGGASQTPAAFGSPATPAFGTAASTPAPTFGAGAQSTPNIFGMPNQNNQGGMFSSGSQNAPMFGSPQPQPAGGVFGRPAAPAFGSPGASLPPFEAPSPAPAPTPSFNFSQPTAGVFGFGQQQAQGGAQTGAGVYNFGGAPAQGQMQFNMGAPGAAVRRVRKAVRRR